MVGRIPEHPTHLNSTNTRRWLRDLDAAASIASASSSRPRTRATGPPLVSRVKFRKVHRLETCRSPRAGMVCDVFMVNPGAFVRGAQGHR